ncbi:hypothetical protein pEaSNUABM37_00179 [Erwinia phage pEa_SNUABM_37]|nr:hypothetical protein pEaSNUABM37_00179 [Erwinia phage pEa_SNUABM_37]QXO10649.1 hypothetical protein pEaSNUABM48_00179 [Erwinia phage pEa_SNUABM_48]
MGGPSLEALLAVFNDAYEQFVTDNRYSGMTPELLHGRAMAYARDKLQGTWPLTRD